MKAARDETVHRDGTGTPATLAAFARAFKEVNKDALLQLHRKLIERLAMLGDSDLGENGRKLRDSTADDFVERVFHLVMMQPMVPENYREDHRHCDGGASILHMGMNGLTADLFANKTRIVRGQ